MAYWVIDYAFYPVGDVYSQVNKHGGPSPFASTGDITNAHESYRRSSPSYLKVPVVCRCAMC